MKWSRIGFILILAGAAVWPIGLYVFHLNAIPDCLVPHLSFVIPGFILRRWDFLKRVGKKIVSSE